MHVLGFTAYDAMFEFAITDEHSIKCITAKGRIDALSASDIRKIFDGLILAGERTLLVDMAGVHYVSSAGLRIFIGTQKDLKKVGGEIILSGINEAVFEVFKMSGLASFFRVVADREAVSDLLHRDASPVERNTREIDGIAVEYMETTSAKGRLFTAGSYDKTEDASYTEADVAEVRPADMRFGCGLAALGNTYDEYKDLFGESMVVDHAFFYYPAVKHPSVDFLIGAHHDPRITYKFLHSFGFNGSYRYLLSFQGKERAVELSALVRSFFSISRANLVGLVLIAESKGVLGMHIKQIPIAEHKPANGKGIFDAANFSEWIDFPVEPSHVNNVVVATGIAVRDRAYLDAKHAFLISEGGGFHIHGTIFDKAPWETISITLIKS